MKSKLTISLNNDTIESAKSYAKSNKISLSNLIESYPNSLPKKVGNRKTVSQFVESLTGILPQKTDDIYKREYYDYLNQKYR